MRIFAGGAPSPPPSRVPHEVLPLQERQSSDSTKKAAREMALLNTDWFEVRVKTRRPFRCLGLLEIVNTSHKNRFEALIMRAL